VTVPERWVRKRRLWLCKPVASLSRPEHLLSQPEHPCASLSSAIFGKQGDPSGGGFPVLTLPLYNNSLYNNRLYNDRLYYHESHTDPHVGSWLGTAAELPTTHAQLPGSVRGRSG
jgi:hypothetical protein